MAKNKIITTQGNVQFINSKGRAINVHPYHVYSVYEGDTVSFLFIGMKDYSGQAIFASQYEDLELNGVTYGNMEDLKDAIGVAFAHAGAQARAEIVTELPEDPYTNTIYLVKKEHGEGYDEYIWNEEEEEWELIGDTDIEFERYLQITDFNAYSAATSTKINTLSGAIDTNAADIVSLSGAIDSEIAAREAADASISGAVDNVSANIANEVSRATSAETALGSRIDTVNGRVDAEQLARANADNALSGAIDTVASDLASEVSARTSADASLQSAIDSEIAAREAADNVISGAVDNVSADLANEAQRASDAESALNTKIDTISGAVDSVASDLADEVSARTAADAAIDGRVDTLSASVETMGDDKAEKAEAVASAEYVSSSTTINFKNISGEVISSIDASDFVVDGMVEDVRIENGYLVIDFNTASGIEDIEIPLSDIFNPENYYDKDAIDGIVSGINDSIDAKADPYVAGSGITINGNVISAEAQHIDVDMSLDSGSTNPVANSAVTTTILSNEMVTSTALNDLNTRLNTLSGSMSGYQETLVAGDGIEISGNVISVGEGVGEQSDWNESDSGSTAYIKNRPFGGTGQYECKIYAHPSNTMNIEDAQLFDIGETLTVGKYYQFRYDYEYHESCDGYNESIFTGEIKLNDTSVYTAYTYICGYNEEEPWGAFGVSNDLRHWKPIQIMSGAYGVYILVYNFERDPLVQLDSKYIKNDIQRTLSAGTGISIVGNVISATGSGGISSADCQSMIDESISGKVNTSAVVSSVTSASTDSEIPTAKAVYDAIPTGGTGGDVIAINSKFASGGTVGDLVREGYFNSGRVRYTLVTIAIDGNTSLDWVGSCAGINGGGTLAFSCSHIDSNLEYIYFVVNDFTEFYNKFSTESSIMSDGNRFYVDIKDNPFTITATTYDGVALFGSDCNSLFSIVYKSYGDSEKEYIPDFNATGLPVYRFDIGVPMYYDSTYFNMMYDNSNSALTKANSALTAANNAQNSANVAQSTATTAYNKAVSAQTTANNALSAATVQSDWNQNDSGSTHNDYIKNRPFYSIISASTTPTLVDDINDESWSMNPGCINAGDQFEFQTTSTLNVGDYVVMATNSEWSEHPNYVFTKREILLYDNGQGYTELYTDSDGGSTTSIASRDGIHWTLYWYGSTNCVAPHLFKFETVESVVKLDSKYIDSDIARASRLGGLSLVKISQSDYDALVQGGTTDPNTLYIISD